MLAFMSLSFLTGQLLLAMPDLPDPLFARSAIAICAHNETGAFGVCIHHSITELSLPDLMRQLEIDPGPTPPTPVLLGGPVEQDRGFVLHSPDFSGDDTSFIGDHFALTSTRDILEAIATGSGPEHWMAVLGYAGWGPGQLEQEMLVNSWLAVPASQKLLWQTEPSDRWTLGFNEAGIDLGMLSTGFGNA